MAGFGTQSNALFRKSVAYQRKNWGTNLCLLLSPIVFTLMLYGIQVAIDNALDTRDNRCGCECLYCCTFNETSLQDDCTSSCLPSPNSYDECREYNDDNCGQAYSTSEQVVFCPIPSPNIWPPIQQIPREKYRAIENKPKVTFLYTGNDKQIADELTATMFNPTYDLAISFDNAIANLPPGFPPVSSLSDVLAGLSGLQQQASSQDLAEQEFDYLSLFTDPFDLSSSAQAGIILGSSSETTTSYLLESAYFPFGDDRDTVQPVFIVARNCTLSVQEVATALDQPVGIVNSFLDLLGVQVQNNAIQIDDIANNPNTTWLITGTLNPIVNGLVQYECVENVFNYEQSDQGINDKLFCGFKQARCEGVSTFNEYSAAFDWQDTNQQNLNLKIWHNDTNEVGDDGGPPDLQRYSENMNQAISAWLKWITPVNVDIPSLTNQLIGIMDMPTRGFELKLEISSFLGALFYLWLIQLVVPVMLYQLVYEKEKKLRMMMNMHGLGEAVYWFVNYIWYLTLYCAYMIVLLIFGSLPFMDLAFFRLNSYGIQIIFYFLYGNCQIAFAFLVSCLFGTAKTAVVAGLLWILASSLIGAIILNNLYQNDRWYVVLLELVPQFGAYRGLYEFSEYSFLGTYKNSNGLEFENLSDDRNGMTRVWIYFIVEWFVFMVLAWYLQQVLDSGTGVRKHALFFLDYCRRNKREVTIEIESARSSLRQGEHSEAYLDLTEDVQREKSRVEALTPEQLEHTSIVVNNLRKTFPAMDGNPEKKAVRQLTLAVDKGEVFGLLGPNGAGKSTSINMMVGLLEPSNGTAIVAGRDIRYDMNHIYQDMGVCPQHDLLWENLTGREHLFFYARLKGIKEFAELKQMVDAALSRVNLLQDGDKRVKQYSGGMKRRLSVAISLIGNPKVVYMDEPSTGLDPSSRRLLWDVVISQRENRAIILTTHSMEEAEVLCDRLGIFVDGRLVCIGNPKQITSRYAGYFVFTIMVPLELKPQAIQLVRNMSPNAVETYSLDGLMKFELPTREVTLSQVFKTMEDAKTKLQIKDWAVTSATLEEVFIKLATQVEAKSAEMHLDG